MTSTSPSTSKIKPSPDQVTRGKKQWMIYAGGVVIVLLFALINIFVYRYSQRMARQKLGFGIINKLSKESGLTPTPTSTPTPTPKPTPTPRPIPSGKKTFSVSSGKKTGPQFRTGFIDPYDPKSGTGQTISISLVGSKPVTTAKLTMQTDTKSKEVVMSLTSGTASEGVWEGTWTVDDTYLYTYNATIAASDGQETNTITITLR